MEIADFVEDGQGQGGSYPREGHQGLAEGVWEGDGLEVVVELLDVLGEQVESFEEHQTEVGGFRRQLQGGEVFGLELFRNRSQTTFPFCWIGS